MAKTVAVVGATGAQGGSVVAALVERGVAVRALTRKPLQCHLTGNGVQVMYADYDQPTTLHTAFQACDAVFLVSDFWGGAGMDGDREAAQARSMMDAAKAAGVGHVVWSGLEDTRLIAGGKLTRPDGKRTVPFFDSKAEATEHLRSLGIPFTVVYASCYYELFLGPLAPQPVGDHLFASFFNTGEAVLPMVAVADIGRLVAAIIDQGPEETGGKVYSAHGALCKFSEYGQVMADATGEKVQCISLPDEQWVAAALGAGAPQLRAHSFANMGAYMREFKEAHLAPRLANSTSTLVPNMTSFADWCTANKGALLAAMHKSSTPAGPVA